MKSVLIFGAGDFSNVVRALANECGRKVVGVIDETVNSSDVLDGLESAIKSFPPEVCEIVLAVGYSDLSARWLARERIRDAGYKLATLIHPAAYVYNVEKIAEGCLLMAGAVVDVNASLGEVVVVWPGVVVNHDSRIDENTFLSPNCTVCGFVRVGRQTFIGAGAIIADHVVVPEGTFIKAGNVYSKGRSV
jgi:sugar O-acyltransferase (sialic acid O-acetyltransferase NeuD family)